MRSKDETQSRRSGAHRWVSVAGAPAAPPPDAPGRTPELQRFVELMAAFADLARERRDVVLRGSPTLPVQGFAVRLQPGPTAAGAELSLCPDGGRLTTWSRAGEAQRASGDGHAVRLELSVAFRWENLIFTDADRLARTLLRWIEDQIGGETMALPLAEAP